MNRLHIPNNLTISDDSGDPVESHTNDSLGTTTEDLEEDGLELDDLDDLDEEPDPVAWTDPTNDREDDQWQVAVNNELLSLRRNQYGRPESGIAFSGWVLRRPTDAPRGARSRASLWMKQKMVRIP